MDDRDTWEACLEAGVGVWCTNDPQGAKVMHWARRGLVRSTALLVVSCHLFFTFLGPLPSFSQDFIVGARAKCGFKPEPAAAAWETLALTYRSRMPRKARAQSKAGANRP